MLDEVSGMNIPQRQLSSLLQSLNGLNLNESFSRQVMSNHLKEAIQPLKHTFTLGLEDGQEFSWVILHPGRLLQKLLDDSPQLMEAFAEAANKAEPSQDHPWTLLMGFDEFAPGNKLKVLNHRILEEKAISFISRSISYHL